MNQAGTSRFPRLLRRHNIATTNLQTIGLHVAAAVIRVVSICLTVMIQRFVSRIAAFPRSQVDVLAHPGASRASGELAEHAWRVHRASG
jgi:hypothetical protein